MEAEAAGAAGSGSSGERSEGEEGEYVYDLYAAAAAAAGAEAGAEGGHERWMDLYASGHAPVIQASEPGLVELRRQGDCGALKQAVPSAGFQRCAAKGIVAH